MLILIFLFLSSFLYAETSFTFHYDSETKAFQRIYNEIESGRVTLNRHFFSRYQIFFVQGLSTDVTHKLGSILGPVISEQEGLLSPFYQQKKLLDELNIPSAFIPLNPNDGCAKNGETIARFLSLKASQKKKVILITQSKAGPDVLHALVKYPDMMKYVAGWIAYQPPHSGTYLAEAPTNGPVRKGLINLLYKTLKGSGLAITEMRRDFRQTFMKKHADKVSTIYSRIPVITLVTDDLPLTESGSIYQYLAVPFFGQSDEISFLSPFVGPIDRNGGGLNDGIATVDGTCLLKSDCIYLHGIDHFAAVMNTSPYKTLSKEERLLVFQALLQKMYKKLSLL